MPELPEVETIKNDLRPLVVGRKFTDVRFLWSGMVIQPSPDQLARHLRGLKVEDIARRGKYLILRLSSGEALILHMRMSGSLIVLDDGQVSPQLEKYTRAMFGLDNGSKLIFHDKRKLGKVLLAPDERLLSDRLGPEPLEPSFTPELLAQRLSRRSAPIKAVLCDQEVIAGVGNMYADEALFDTRIHPLTPANSLSPDEKKRLHRAIVRVLRDAIESGGASVSDYVRPGGQQGKTQETFKVAHLGGAPCPVCGTPIARIVVRQRGTYFCPRCQPAPDVPTRPSSRRRPAKSRR